MIHSKLLKAFMSLMVTAALLTEAARVKQGKNKLEHAALCRLVQIATSEIQLQTLTSNAEAAYHRLQKLNMSLSAESWQRMFSEGGKGKTWHDTPDKAGIKHNHWNALWSDWLKAARELKANANDADIKQANYSEISKSNLGLARAALHAMTLSARASVQSLPTVHPEAEALTPASVRKTVTDAVYGEGQTAATSASAHGKMLRSAKTGTARATHCTTAAATDGPITVAGFIVCLCYKEQNSGEPEVCTHGQDAGAAWNSGAGATAGTNGKKLLDNCGNQAAGPLRGTDLLTAIKAIENLITIQSTDGYLGAHNTGGCSGAKTASICVKLASYKTDKKGAEDTAQWITTLKKLATQLEEGDKRNEADQQATTSINKQLNRALQLADELAFVNYATPATALPVAASTVTCKPQNKTEAECQAEHCDYDAKKIECKPKPGAPTTAAETGDEASGATASAGCAAHRDKTACEKDKTGEKQNCAWRKGKDNEDEKGTEKCRNGSFLEKNNSL